MMTQENNDTQVPEVDFHGAAVISKNGKEVPITEEMVRQACEEMGSEESSSAEQ